MPRGLSLRKNFLWTFSGNVIYAGCQWGMLMALAKLGSPEMVGQFALGLAIGAPVMMFANLQLRAILGTDVQDDFRFGEYWALRIVTSIGATLVIASVALVGGYRWETFLVVVVVGVSKGIESNSDIMYGLFQRCERLDRIAVAMILRGIGSVILFGLALWATGSVAWAAGALATWWGIILSAYEWRAAAALLARFGRAGDRVVPTWVLPRMGRLAWLAMPLGLVTALSSLNTNIPRYFVAHHFGEESLGYFAAIAYTMVVGSTIINALGQSAAPRLARYYSSNQAAYLRLLGKMFLLSIVLGAGAVVIVEMWGAKVLSLLYRPDYAEYQPEFACLTVAAGLAYVASILTTGMTAARIYRPQVPLMLFTSMATLTVCWLGSDSYGLLAAAYGLLAGSAFLALGSAVVLAVSLARGPSQAGTVVKASTRRSYL
jgi:O-antigen/teichoic acid export membrane protein